MSEQLLEQLHDAITGLEESKAQEISRRGIEEGLDPLDLINHSIRPALELVGTRFSMGDIFLPELMIAANAADAAVAVLEPALLNSGAARPTRGKVLLATVEGDMHNIGKNIVGLLLKASGFEVVDLGVDNAPEAILDAAITNDVELIGLSGLLTTTLPRMSESIELLEHRGLRNQFKVIVGGAPVTQDFADSIGADGYGPDAVAGVELTTRLLGGSNP